ncbi:MAG: aminopeptidase N [Pseudomonadota bacterium]
MRTDTPRPIRLKNYKPAPFTIDKVSLDFQLDRTATRVTSRLHMRPNPSADTPTADAKSAKAKSTRSAKGSKAEASTGTLVLDGELLELESLKLNGEPLPRSRYRVGKETLTIRQVPRAPFTLDIVTTCNPEANKALSGLYVSRGMFCTQCEAEGFRRITYFLDRPDVLATYTVRIEADAEAASTLLSNGNLRERGTLAEGKRHYAIWRDPHPKPSYLFALVGGHLASIASTFTTSEGEHVDLRIYVEPGKEDRCGWAMDALKRSMAWDERRFGRAYDLEVFNIVAVSDFNMGAMENKGLNIFNDRLILASPQTASDATYAAIEAVIAHEYFHNWTGNRITCRDWFQLCLKEGLTVYRDQEFTADERSRAVERINDVRRLKLSQFPEDAGPLAHPVRPASYIEINNFYTATVYEKGAELCRMIATLLGEAGFRAGMNLFFERHDGEAATVEDFIACFAHVSGRDLSQFMIWYQQAGTPELVCSLDHDQAAQTATLHVEQVLPPTPGQQRKKPLHMPLALGLLAPDGEELALKLKDGDVVENGIIELTQRRQSFTFEGVRERPVPSLLRHFSAPCNLTIDLSDHDYAFLIAHDRDPFNRWQAVQSFVTRTMQRFITAARTGKNPGSADQLIEALRAAFFDRKLEPAYRAELMRLPGETALARIIAHDIDPDAIHKGCHQVMRAIARALGPEFEKLYRTTKPKRTYDPSAEQMGLRAQRLAALTLLAYRGEAADKDRVVQHFKGANNMTDQSAALYLIATHVPAARQATFAAFHERWKDDHLTINAWFAAQAMVPTASTLERIKTLQRHALYSATTPNNVSAVVNTFATVNPVQFNRADGEGYAFLADEVLKANAFNPQLAARLMTQLRGWKTLEPQRRKRAQAELKRIAKAPGLSNDVFEIVTKMLD